MIEQGIDLDAYCARIGCAENIGPTLETLQEIVLRHSEQIPFENLNVLMGWPVLLDLASLQNKLVFGGRGGYCFEQNLLLKAALETIGFRVTGLAARVLWNVPPGTINPRQHMLLCVEIDTMPFIADVGFGALTPTGVLRLEPGVEQPTPHEIFRLTRADDDFVLEARTDGVWKPLYSFDLHPQLLPDYEVSNWYVSTHPRSHFVHDLVAARPEPNRRYTLHNRKFTIRHLGGPTERRTLADVEDIRDVLQNTFRITLPDTPDLDEALEKAVRNSDVSAVAI